MSGNGFGMFSTRLKPLYPAGQFGVYYAAATYYKYTYANDSVVTHGVSGATASTAFKACCANVWEGLYTVGTGGSLCQRLNWSASTIASRSPGLINASQFFSGTGNDVQGIIPTTVGSTAGTNIYTFVANTLVAGTNMGTFGTNGGACGNRDFGLFCVGGSSGSAGALTNVKYFHSSGGVANGTAFTGSATNNGAASIAEFGIIGRGQNAVLQSFKYTFANDAVAPATAFKAARQAAGAWGNDVVGVFATNAVNTFDRYLYAADTTTLVTAAPVNVAQGAQGATNGIPGVSYFG
jgi:hypothetical protein